jgi:hypothetical protein
MLQQFQYAMCASVLFLLEVRGTLVYTSGAVQHRQDDMRYTLSHYVVLREHS